jgi:hypothetical protein
MKEQTQHRHKAGAEPVVIHHVEEPTILARWLKQGLEKGVGFWLLVLGGTVLGLALILWASAWASRPHEGSKAWIEVMVPSQNRKSAGGGKYEGMPEQVRPLIALADEAPESSAARWALLRAATLVYQEGLRDLPNQRETARPTLQQALELFDRVLATAPPDAPEALMAAAGKARALESRGELDDAIKQYEEVASRWPNTKQAEAARKRATELADPSVKKFYDDFFTMDLSQIPTAGSGSGSSGLPGSLFGDPIVPPLGNIPLLSDPAAAPAMTPGGEFPKELFAPETGASPEPDPPSESPAPASPEPGAAPTSSAPSSPESPAPAPPAGETPKP